MIGVWGKQLSSSVRSRQSGADAVQAQPVLSHNAAVPLGRFRIRSIWPYLRPATLAPYIVSLPIAGLVAGLLLPSLSREVMATLPIWSATLVGAACLGLAVQRISRKEVGLVATLVVASAIVAPSFSYAFGRTMGAAPPLLGCIILASGASVAFGAGPTLARFGLPDRAALAAALTSALLLPATALMAAHLLTAAPIGLPQLPISLSALTERLSEIVFLPALLAFAMRASIPGWISDHRGDCRGVVVAMLILVALARGNVLDHGFAVGARLLWTVALAFGVSVIWATAGWLTLRPFGRAAGMVGCVCGGRKAVPFVWAAVADVLPPESQLFMVMLVFPVCLLPVILAWAERFGWFGAAALKRQSGNPAAATEQTESIPAQARRPAARPG